MKSEEKFPLFINQLLKKQRHFSVNEKCRFILYIYCSTHKCCK
ncbi:hypothetical protein CF65_00157 [Aggregatibacter actinomycetemcomitans HK1651]|nr:hypothetical protein CF65_00157 [Aggregatibacter actinomycetemcomitans HK1651]